MLQATRGAVYYMYNGAFPYCTNGVPFETNGAFRNGAFETNGAV